ncbi:hypothetical protein LCGC14_1463520 [marine sediment metagenome]|uniref:Uncharacterized protein n=1 Tax=marine sediment metagenome TaxID=412755 RepID=A0A0F9JEX1_9ZZZZ
MSLDLKLLDTLTVYGQEYAVSEIYMGPEHIRITAVRTTSKQIDQLRKMAWNKLGLCPGCLKEMINNGP